MNEIAIRCEGLSKHYRIGERKSYKALRDVLTDAATTPFRRVRSLLGNGNGSSIRSSQTEIRNSIWALDDLSFEVKRGEVVGIIGRNGAGKSTLLKILSRITKPTKGYAEIHGRVGSLLEVGTGFHPELTGRENIYLNAAILGMQKAEVQKKFDEIVAFAEVEKFVDTPVKRYSSGMYVRLAFAVAAHMETEVLLVDEVLAVGDVQFQKRCLGKMGEIAARGRTVLFVSHSMPAIQRLCQRAILLGDGKILNDGSTSIVVDSYLNSGVSSPALREWLDLAPIPGNEVVRVKRVRVCSQQGETVESSDIREAVGIEMVYEVLEGGRVLVPNYHLVNEDGTCICVIQDLGEEWRQRPRPIGIYTSTAWLPGNFLAEGRVLVSAAISTYSPFIVHVFERDVVAFRVVESFDGHSARGDYGGHMPGVVRPIVPWTTSQGITT
jgi:lipopolysaccharide transport system ATP-binding protein